MFDSGKTIPFEIAVGMNGRVWLRGRSVKETICLGTKLITNIFTIKEPERNGTMGSSLH